MLLGDIPYKITVINHNNRNNKNDNTLTVLSEPDLPDERKYPGPAGSSVPLGKRELLNFSSL